MHTLGCSSDLIELRTNICFLQSTEDIVTASLERGLEDEAQFQTETCAEKQVQTAITEKQYQTSGGQLFTCKYSSNFELDDVFNNTQSTPEEYNIVYAIIITPFMHSTGKI